MTHNAIITQSEQRLAVGAAAKSRCSSSLKAARLNVDFFLPFDLIESTKSKKQSR